MQQSYSETKLFFILFYFTLQPDHMLTILIISEAQGTLPAFQQHYCHWPYNRKAHYTSALETETEVATVKRCLNECVIPYT